MPSNARRWRFSRGSRCATHSRRIHSSPRTPPARRRTPGTGVRQRVDARERRTCVRDRSAVVGGAVANARRDGAANAARPSFRFGRRTAGARLRRWLLADLACDTDPNARTRRWQSVFRTGSIWVVKPGFDLDLGYQTHLTRSGFGSVAGGSDRALVSFGGGHLQAHLPASRAWKVALLKVDSLAGRSGKDRNLDTCDSG